MFVQVCMHVEWLLIWTPLSWNTNLSQAFSKQMAFTSAIPWVPFLVTAWCNYFINMHDALKRYLFWQRYFSLQGRGMRKFKEVMACEHRTFGNRLKDNFVEVKTFRRCYACSAWGHQRILWRYSGVFARMAKWWKVKTYNIFVNFKQCMKSH